MATAHFRMWGLLGLLGLAACSEPEPGLGDAGRADSGPGDSGRPADLGFDLGSEDAGYEDAGHADAGSEDAGGEDAGMPDQGEADQGVNDVGLADSGALDTGPLDQGTSDAGPTCNDVLLDSVIVECSGSYAYARIFGVRPRVRGCDDSVLLLGSRYPDVPTAITSLGCGTDCIWQASMSVSYVDHCNRRNGYIVFTASDPTKCPSLYEFSSGIYASVMDYEADTPCP